VESRLAVQQPKGYLVPKNDSLLVNILRKHGMTYREYTHKSAEKVFQYIPEYGEKTVFEEFEVPVRSVKKEAVKKVASAQYYYVPIEQRKSTMMTLAFEPQSMINLLQYDRFEYLMKEKVWPVLRVE
jgi:hypothetical protein